MTQAQKQQATDTQQKIVEAALACVKRWGVEKVTLNDIAKEARVTRPTVYSYFKTRDDVIRYALLQSAYGFSQKLFKVIDSEETPRDRLLESFLYALKHLPNEPYLEMVTDAGLSAILNAHALNAPDGLEITRGLFRLIFKEEEPSDAELDEIIEVTMRMILSLLTVDSPVKRNDNEMRSFLERRLLPSLGLS